MVQLTLNVGLFEIVVFSLNFPCQTHKSSPLRDVSTMGPEKNDTGVCDVCHVGSISA